MYTIQEFFIKLPFFEKCNRIEPVQTFSALEMEFVSVSVPVLNVERLISANGSGTGSIP